MIYLLPKYNSVNLKTLSAPNLNSYSEVGIVLFISPFFISISVLCKVES